MIKKPKSLYEVLNQMSHRDLNGSFSEKPQKRKYSMLKAYSNKYAGRTVVIGESVFKFSGDGYCEVKDSGYTLYDFKQLCNMKSVKEVKEQKPKKEKPKLEAKEPSTEKRSTEAEKKEEKQEPKGEYKDSGSGKKPETKTKKQSSKPRKKMSFSLDKDKKETEEDVNDD